MSFLGGIVDAVGSGLKSVVHAGEDVVGGALKVGEGVVHAGIDTIGDIAKNPLELLNPFAVIKDAGGNLVKDVVAEFNPSLIKNVGNAISTATQSGGGIGGLVNQVGNLANKVSSLADQLSKLNPDSPTYLADVTK